MIAERSQGTLIPMECPGCGKYLGEFTRSSVVVHGRCGERAVPVKKSKTKGE